MVHYTVLSYFLKTCLFCFVFCNDLPDETLATEFNISTLKFVHAIWRHGDRNPFTIFPTDLNNIESTWPQGFGELTAKGIRQHYDLGKFLKQRYKNFLSEGYNAKEIHVRSTGYNRTIMSALSNLAGMYPPTSSDAWNDEIGWHPIPVHSQPRDTDPLLEMNVPCPVVTKLTQAYFDTSPVVQKIIQENENFFKFLENKTGLRNVSLKNIHHVGDSLICINAHNATHKWPSWVNQSIFDKVIRLMNLMTTFMYPTAEIQRFRGGPLLLEIATRIKEKATRLDSWPLKYFAYSAHIRTIIAVMSNLDIHDGYFTPYAGAVLFELHQRDNQFYVEVLKKSGTSDVVKIAIPKCNPCTVDTFLSLIKMNSNSDFVNSCKNVDSQNH